MDTTKTITHLSLCAGYGGIDLGLRRILPTLRTISYVEIEAFAIANLVAKMEEGKLDAAPVWTNLKTCDWSIFRDRVDIISGGYPCQPFSSAGERAGANDSKGRHLWPFIQGAIGIIRPRYCFFENVEGHLTLGFKDVCHDLGELGYELTAGIFSAAECGAPHQRKRIFILAHRCGERSAAGLPESEQRQAWFTEIADNGGDRKWPARPGEPQHEWEEPRVVGDPKGGQSGQQETGDGRESAGGTSSTELADTSSKRNRESEQGVPKPNQCIQGRKEGSTHAGGCVQTELGDSKGERPGTRGAEHEGKQRRSATASPSAELADAGHPEPSGRDEEKEGGEGQPCGESAPQDCGDGELADTSSSGQQECGEEGNGGASSEGSASPVDAPKTGANDGDAEHEIKSKLGRATDGTASGLDPTANRVDRLRLLGNGVVPSTCEVAFRTLYNELMNDYSDNEL